MTSNEPKTFSSVSYSAAPTSETTDAGVEPMTVFMSSAQPTTSPTIVSSPAYTEVPNFKVLRLPDKSRRTCCQKWALYCCLVGFVFIIASVIW